MFNEAVTHLDLDAFFVSVERLHNRQLSGKPVIIGGTSNRGVVASCSYEARKMGVHSAMPMKRALQLCPEAIVVRGDMDEYSKYSKLVTDVISSKAPQFEKSSIDEFYIDLSGMDKYFGCFQWSKELRQKIISETGLPITFGLAVNKLVSKVGAGTAKPNGEIVIRQGSEKQFIQALPIRKLPGIGPVTASQLELMGVKTIKTLSELPKGLLTQTFGKKGIEFWEKAHAIDRSKVIPYREQKSISKEQTFREDTLDLKMIESIIVDMTEKLAYELRQQKRLTSCVTMKIRYADFNTYTKQKKISFTAKDAHLIQYALNLFDQLYNRRQMIRLVGVKFSSLVHGFPQISLFEDSSKSIDLLKQLDHIRSKYGIHSIGRATGLKNDK